MANYYAGTSGMVLPVPNKSYYPQEFKERSRLCYYGSLFNSIEVNSSFYKIPQARTIAKWAQDVPPDFRFTFKLWRGITHEKGLVFNRDDIYRFMQAIDSAGEKKGCLLVQFPPGAKAHLMPQLTALVNYIRDADREQRWKIALEFRHASWYNDNIREFAANHVLSIVLQDIPASATPLDFADNVTIYLRFHGPGGKYRGSYDDYILQEYSTYIRDWQGEGKTVYVYFNNTMGDAVQNLATLNRLVNNH
ncbi:MAG: hypothetical protein JWQ34_3409 [Mucilaginibacter sp.]|uniref:DUF72 domain-containing protein n=1 Tax=Mucilaginibacter sp. TaxID=1882438 RepID=UPI002611DA4B|nr:DUF72 domain-containing protein [Mucilaginibacter sp.]MDB5005184.1 hypothetical protein [Mucilaginibacter sp.]